MAFARNGDLWLANADGSGQRRLAATPNVDEWGPSWLPDGIGDRLHGARRRLDGRSASCGCRRRRRTTRGEQRRGVRRDGVAQRASSRSSRLAAARRRSTSPQSNGTGATPFDTTPPATPFTDVHDLAWSPDGTKLAYVADLRRRHDARSSSTTARRRRCYPRGERPVWSPAGTRIAFASGVNLHVGRRRRHRRAHARHRRCRSTGASCPSACRSSRTSCSGRRAGSSLETRGRGHWLLGFTSMVDNRGPGILWIRGTRAARRAR